MSLLQFLRIFWVRRTMLFASAASTLIGALLVCALLPARWDGKARVILDTIKPDPVTGMVLAGTSNHIYVANQIELITDYAVAGQVAEQVGWFTDPKMIKMYNKRSSSDVRDFRHFLSDYIIQNTKAKLILDSNILEIQYTSATPESARAVAEALRSSYIAAATRFNREDAEQNAESYEQQAVRAKAALDQAASALSAFERQSGVVMETNKVDAESARLQALTQQSAPIIMPSATPVATTSAGSELAAVDAQIASASKSLGPNNPEMLALKAKRENLAGVVASERANAARAESRMAGGIGALEAQVERQKSKVIAQRDVVSKLNELQQEVDLRRDIYTKLQAKVAEFREKSVAEPPVTSLGNATIPKAPSFPNYFLIVPGALVLGSLLGGGVALLSELLRRRVRGPDELDGVGDAPLVCVVPKPLTTAEKQARRTSFIVSWRARLGGARA